MERNNTTCKVKADALQGLNNAFYAFAEAENMQELSAKLGFRQSLLRNKLNPEQTHKLSVEDLLLITKESQNYCIVNSLLLALDLVAVNVKQDAQKQSLAQRALDNSIISGELARLT